MKIVRIRGLKSVLFLFWKLGGGNLVTPFLIPSLMAICAILTFVVGLLTFSRNRDKDVKNDASESAVIKTKLDNISSGIDSIRIDIKANERRVSELSERVIRVEESSKQAHKRIDKFENKGGNVE
jgi:peptidoglycan hydrolase CwlO-like protein